MEKLIYAVRRGSPAARPAGDGCIESTRHAGMGKVLPNNPPKRAAGVATCHRFTLDRLGLKFHGWTVWLKLAAALSYAGVWGLIWWMMT